MNLPLQWVDRVTPGRTLILVFAYHGADRDRPTASAIERVEGPGAHGHRIVHRDHYANPRTFSYQMALVAQAIEVLSPDGVPDVVVDSAFSAINLPTGAQACDLANPRSWRDALPTRARDYDNVVAVYPDALGLGCERAERRLLREQPSLLIINGRRRVFRASSVGAMRLVVHRWLASTRAVERALAIAVRPFAGALAIWDRVAGRSA